MEWSNRLLSDRISFMDPVVIVVILVIVMPLGTFWALSKSAQLRGPVSRPESKKRVGSLVTEAIPEEHPEADSDVMDRPARD